MKKDGTANTDFVLFLANFEEVGVFFVAEFFGDGFDFGDGFFEAIITGGTAGGVYFVGHFK